MASIAANLRKLRNLRKLSQRELARMTGLSQAEISKIEGSGGATVRTDTVELLAGKLGVKPGDLCWGDV